MLGICWATCCVEQGDPGPAVADVGGACETRHMSNHARDARRLTPVEVATAGALSGLAVTFGLIAAVTPVFQLFFQVATAVPLAMVSLKLRPRASVAAFASTVLLAIAVGGFATAGRAFQAALIGLIIGFLHKKRASWLSVSAVAAGLGLVWGVGTGIAFWILVDLRNLGLESIQKTLNGFLKLVGPEFLAAFPQRVVNTHNALLPSFPGIHGPADALAYGVKVTGATLFVVDPGMDTGPILGQTTCPVLEGDSEEALVERIKEVERVQLVELIGRMAREGWWVEGRKAGIGARSR